MMDKIKAFFGGLLKKAKQNIPYTVSLAVMILAGIGLVIYLCIYFSEARKVSESVEHLKEVKQQVLLESALTPQPEFVKDSDLVITPSKKPENTPEPTLAPVLSPDVTKVPDPVETPEPAFTPEPTATPEPDYVVMLPEGKAFYEMNSDYAGWLLIPDTVFDYPVVTEKADDTNYYLSHLFDGTYNLNGTLFTLNSCEVGAGRASDAGKEGYTKPSTNIIIFGHNQKNGKMFGTLSKYLDKDFCEKHKLLYFDTAYEHRVYELTAVFRSHVFSQNDTGFRYYYFFNADNEAEFDYWITNIKEKDEVGLSVSAVYGDEFITLSTCSDTDETGNLNKNGRLAVVFKRIE